MFAAGVAATAVAAPTGSAQTDDVVSFFQTRKGFMPTVSQQAHINSWRAAHPGATSATTATGGQFSYSGGLNGQGVMSGAKTKAYLVFYGNQWGTQSTDTNGSAAFTGDPSGVASVTQQMFKRIGANNEAWSADLTQWCDGSTVSSGATSCPSNTPASAFVSYQSGGTLAGIWYDNAAAEPNSPNGRALAVEANAAAGHFGDTTAASNRNAYYIIMSAHGTDPERLPEPVLRLARLERRLGQPVRRRRPLLLRQRHRLLQPAVQHRLRPGLRCELRQRRCHRRLHDDSRPRVARDGVTPTRTPPGTAPAARTPTSARGSAPAGPAARPTSPSGPSAATPSRRRGRTTPTAARSATRSSTTAAARATRSR